MTKRAARDQTCRNSESPVLTRSIVLPTSALMTHARRYSETRSDVNGASHTERYKYENPHSFVADVGFIRLI